MFPKVVLYQQYMPPRSLDVPAGLSDDEVVRRTIDAVERRCVIGFVVWDASRMTRLTPAGLRSEETTTSVILNALPLNQSLAPVLHPGDPRYTLPPLHQQARKWLVGRWAVGYPDQLGGWTPFEDSTLEFFDNCRFTWRSPLPWFVGGRGWDVHQRGHALELGLLTRYHWGHWHRLVLVEHHEGRRAWVWRADDERDVLMAVALD